MPIGDVLSADLESHARVVVDAIFKVHSQTGPGLLESAYEACLEDELRKRGVPVERQVAVPIVYDGQPLDVGFRIDLLVDRRIILELKSVEKVIPLYNAQLMTYLKLSGLRLGFLVNFNVPLIKDGIKRVVR